MEQITLVLPEPISLERVSYLINQKGIEPKIANIDLSMVKMKLQYKEEGLGWSVDECDAAEVDYKRYLQLCMVRGKGIVPTSTIDKMWHYHIPDTIAYHKDCNDVFGY